MSVIGDLGFGAYMVEEQPNSRVDVYKGTFTPAGKIVFDGNEVIRVSCSTVNTLNRILANSFRSRLYLFKAERFNAGACPAGESSFLQPNAANLAEVLSNLQGRHVLMQRYCEVVNQVLPQITRVSVKTTRTGTALFSEVRLWSGKSDSERDDLEIPLSDSGTGVAQVLAIVYVVLTSNDTRTIIIDEPNSFLHPGAVRNLINVLKEFPQHQYILTTHSPNVIANCNPSTLTLVRQDENGMSLLHPLDVNDFEDIRFFLSDIGAGLSDVFGAEDILWVEGATEQACFPLIVEQMLSLRLTNTNILGVKSTGDFETKNSKNIIYIYNKLSKANGLLPAAVAFIFDREMRTEKEMSEMQHQCKGVGGDSLIEFLPRRQYENYLIDEDAITALLNEIRNKITAEHGTSEFAQIASDEVKQYVTKWREENQSKPKIGGPIESLDAARLLDNLFDELTMHTVRYQKTEHSVALTRWFLKHKRESLQEIADLLKKCIGRVASQPVRSTPSSMS